MLRVAVLSPQWNTHVSGFVVGVVYSQNGTCSKNSHKFFTYSPEAATLYKFCRCTELWAKSAVLNCLATVMLTQRLWFVNSILKRFTYWCIY